MSNSQLTSAHFTHTWFHWFGLSKNLETHFLNQAVTYLFYIVDLWSNQMQQSLPDPKRKLGWIMNSLLMKTIPIADERVGVQVKLWNPLRTRACALSASAVVIHYEEALYQVWTFTFTFIYCCQLHRIDKLIRCYFCTNCVVSRTVNAVPLQQSTTFAGRFRLSSWLPASLSSKNTECDEISAFDVALSWTFSGSVYFGVWTARFNAATWIDFVCDLFLD